MIRVTVELLPAYAPGTRETLGAVHVINDGTGSRDWGNYDVRLLDADSSDLRAYARVEDFPRDEGWLVLLRDSFHVLEACVRAGIDGPV